MPRPFCSQGCRRQLAHFCPGLRTVLTRQVSTKSVRIFFESPSPPVLCGLNVHYYRSLRDFGIPSRSPSYLPADGRIFPNRPHAIEEILRSAWLNICPFPFQLLSLRVPSESFSSQSTQQAFSDCFASIWFVLMCRFSLVACFSPCSRSGLLSRFFSFSGILFVLSRWRLLAQRQPPPGTPSTGYACLSLQVKSGLVAFDVFPFAAQLFCFPLSQPAGILLRFLPQR